MLYAQQLKKYNRTVNILANANVTKQRPTETTNLSRPYR